MTVSNNSLDVAVLEWCKLMADRNDKHHWSHVVTDAAAFEGSLLTAIGMTKDEFAGYETAMRRYRDKFIAHLDSDAEMDIPQLEQAERAVAFYHSHVVEQEAEGIDLHGLPATGAQMATYYHAEERSAAIRYDAAMQPVAG
ncbi:hypothetical protein ASC68_18815 [Devosia sp. Root105]|nr:hypothetical protein ASC68_18815 [Devosia sp. Root105]